jgi:hypothetical protein
VSMADAAQKTPPRNAYLTRGCMLGRWARTLPEGERAALVKILSDPEWTHTAIADLINTDPDYPGVEFAPATVARHRNRECRCEPF